MEGAGLETLVVEDEEGGGGRANEEGGEGREKVMVELIRGCDGGGAAAGEAVSEPVAEGITEEVEAPEKKGTGGGGFVEVVLPWLFRE